MQNISDCRKIFFHDLVALDYFRVNFHRIAGNLRALTARHSGIPPVARPMADVWFVLPCKASH